MSKHSHISAIFDNAFQSRAGSPDVYMSMENSEGYEPRIVQRDWSSITGEGVVV